MQRKRDWSWLEDWRVKGLAATAFFVGFLMSLGIFGKPWGLPPAWGDIPTWILAIGSVIAAWYAIRAFAGQTREVAAIEQQVRDGQELTRQQAELLQLQGKQLELQQEQIDEQRELNRRQSEVLQLQADELRESLAERKREAAARRVAHASRVFITQTINGNSAAAWIGALARRGGSTTPADITVVARVVNTSDQPIYEVELRWYRGSAGYGEPNPELLGTILPGGDAEHSRDFPGDTNMEVSGVVVRFTDAAGVRWLRRPDGYLNEYQAQPETR